MYSILLVDDEPEIRASIKNNYPWQQLGFQIEWEAGSGDEAIEVLSRAVPDVVLTDIVMPGLSGVDLTKAIREKGLDTRIVFLSGYREFDYAWQALSYDVFRYIVKPVCFEELIQVFTLLRDYLDGDAKTRDDLSAGGVYEQLIIEVRRYVEEHIATASLQDAAAHVAISMPYLSRLFKNHCGVNFSQYLVAAKMERAKELLLERGNLVYEIAERMGYESSKNFARAFKKHFGLTPQEYRQNPNPPVSANTARQAGV